MFGELRGTIKRLERENEALRTEVKRLKFQLGVQKDTVLGLRALQFDNQCKSHAIKE